MDKLVAGKACKAVCVIRNTHHYDTQKLRILLINEASAGVLLCGESGFDLPPLAPKQHVEIELTLLPLKLGMQRVSGLVLVTQNQERYTFDNLATLLVTGGNEAVQEAVANKIPNIVATDAAVMQARTEEMKIE